MSTAGAALLPLLLIYLAIVFGCVMIARRKDRSPLVWGILGLLFHLPALIVIAILPSAQESR